MYQSNGHTLERICSASAIETNDTSGITFIHPLSPDLKIGVRALGSILSNPHEDAHKCYVELCGGSLDADARVALKNRWREGLGEVLSNSGGDGLLEDEFYWTSKSTEEEETRSPLSKVYAEALSTLKTSSKEVDGGSCSTFLDHVSFEDPTNPLRPNMYLKGIDTFLAEHYKSNGNGSSSPAGASSSPSEYRPPSHCVVYGLHFSRFYQPWQCHCHWIFCLR